MFLNVSSVYRTNTPTISWTPPHHGSADFYIVTFTLASGDSFQNRTSETMLATNLKYGEKYEIEIIVVFRQLNSSELNSYTVIGNSSDVQLIVTVFKILI